MKPARAIFFLGCFALFFASNASAQNESARIEFNAVDPAVIRQRLEMVRHKTPERRSVLEDLFRDAGCADVIEQHVPGSKEPNVICSHDGEESSVITVGAHYDADGHGLGAVDDWSGAALLPSLYQSIEKRSRRHRFIFVAFASEEAGLLGSTAYVKQLPKESRALIRAMVNLECLGLTPPKVWAHRADKRLTGRLSAGRQRPSGPTRSGEC